MKFCIWVLFGNVRRKIKFNKNRTKKTGNLHEDQYTFLIISWSAFLRSRNVWDKICWENLSKFLRFNDLFRPSCLYEIMWKIILEPGRPHMTIRHMLFACWIIKATNTHPKFATAKMVAKMRLHVTLYVICLSCCNRIFICFYINNLASATCGLLEILR
jgi:hypothetical protein